MSTLRELGEIRPISNNVPKRYTRLYICVYARGHSSSYLYRNLLELWVGLGNESDAATTVSRVLTRINPFPSMDTLPPLLLNLVLRNVLSKIKIHFIYFKESMIQIYILSKFSLSGTRTQIYYLSRKRGKNFPLVFLSINHQANLVSYV